MLDVKERRRYCENGVALVSYLMKNLNNLGKGGKMKGNKAGYTAIQSRTVGQEQLFENHSEFKNVTDRRTDIPTYRPTRQGVESRVRFLKQKEEA